MFVTTKGTNVRLMLCYDDRSNVNYFLTDDMFSSFMSNSTFVMGESSGKLHIC
jgi:hypothetical protein